MNGKRVGFWAMLAAIAWMLPVAAANQAGRANESEASGGSGGNSASGRASTGRAAGQSGATKAGGTVLSINSAALSFVVEAGGSNAAQVTVTTNNSTTFSMSDGSAATFADLMLDAQVKVQGTAAGTNAFTAQEVEIAGGAGTGKVVSVNATALSFVVQPQAKSASPVTVATSTTTTFQKSDGSTAAFASLAKGELVLVQSTATGTNAASATRVLIVQQGGTCSAVSGSGTVASVNPAAQSFVVQAQNAQATVTTSASTVFQTSAGAAANFASLTAGATVQVKGTSTGSNTVDAQQVIIGSASTSGNARKNHR